MSNSSQQHGPLESLDDWEEDVLRRYPEDSKSSDSQFIDASKSQEAFRDYASDARPSVREFYRLNHRHQTVDFVRRKREEYLRLDRRKMSVWEALEFLDTLVDDSDPDTDLTQIQHLLQTAEAIRADGHPRWFVAAGLMHDVGKVLCLYGEPQWAVVGDTFPVGCRFSEDVVFSEFFAENPDSQIEAFQSETGIYEQHCGLDRVMLSWGHDEYIYHVTKDFLPKEAQYMLRYHSFYAWHREEAYKCLTNDEDREYLRWVRKFNPYDLYTKSAAPPNVEALKPYYDDLIAEFFPGELAW